MSVTLWLDGGVHAELHEASGVARAAVVIVAPFGWEEQSSARLRRVWAQSLADVGYPVLRLDLPGQADSADPDEELLDAWRHAVCRACDVLRERAPRVAVLGLGMGGFPALLAAAAGAADDVALWATPTTGAEALRQLRAFVRLQSGQRPAADAPLWIAGFCLPVPTQARLAALNLAHVPELVTRHRETQRRALLLGRDAAPADPQLAHALVGRGYEVQLAAGPGWAQLVDQPATAQLPDAVVDTFQCWLAAAPASPDAMPTTEQIEPGNPAVGVGSAPVEGRITESVLRLPVDGLEAFAVVTCPVTRADSTLVLLNAGAVPHTGPSRLWVRAARASAAAGVPAVRVDLPGIGESAATGEGAMSDEEFYRPARTAQVAQVLDGLVAAGLPDRFVLAGLCSGAYWSFELGRSDPRVEAVVLLNPLALLWHQSLAGAQLPADVRSHLTRASILRLLSGRSSVKGAQLVGSALLRYLVSMPAAVRARRAAERGGGGNPLLLAFEQLRAAGTVAALAFSDEEPLLRELSGSGLLDSLPDRGVHVHRLGGPAGSHTLAAPALQEAALAVLHAIVVPAQRGPLEPVVPQATA